MRPSQSALLALATAVPPHKLNQSDVATLARRVYARSFARYPKLADIYVNAGIEQRFSAKPIDWFEGKHDWPERTRAYLESASALFVEAAQKALTEARLDARDVDVIVTVSSTGIATPSLEARVGAEMGFRPDVLRVPVFGRGCAGGVVGLSLGARLAQAQPGEVVLVVVVELCTLAFRADRSTKADVISSALFGDGAAALTERLYRGFLAGVDQQKMGDPCAGDGVAEGLVEGTRGNFVDEGGVGGDDVAIGGDDGDGFGNGGDGLFEEVSGGLGDDAVIVLFAALGVDID